MKRLAILGASGHGKVVADAALCAGWDEIVFFDDAWPTRTMNGCWPVAGGFQSLLSNLAGFDGAIVAIGDCGVRLQKHQMLQAAGIPLVIVAHPRATISRFAIIGPGTVMMAGAVVNADTLVGAACIVNTGAVVEHDCRLADGVHVSPGAMLSGGVQVGEGSWVGVGACVRQGVLIGAGVTVGAGAVVVKDLSDGIVAVGCPARPLRSSYDHRP